MSYFKALLFLLLDRCLATLIVPASNLYRKSTVSHRSLQCLRMCSNDFFFAVCKAGAEKPLKAEIAQNHPGARLAFSRPGLVTFKTSSSEKLDENFSLKSIYARAFGISLGPTKTDQDILEKCLVLQSHINCPLRLHVWGREEPGAAAEHPVAIQEAKATVAAVRNRLLNLGSSQGLWLNNAFDGVNTSYNPYYDRIACEVPLEDVAQPGDHVLDIIVPTGTSKSESLFIGHHKQSERSTHIDTFGHSAWPGGNPRVILPPDAPSRAYLKLQEAVLWSGIGNRLVPGQTVLEAGSAPGGASLALLQKGLSVIGVDPCPADRQHAHTVYTHPQFRHIRNTIERVSTNELPRQVDWLVCDANVSPLSLLSPLANLVRHYSSSLRGVMLTLKLGDPSWVDPTKLNSLVESYTSSLNLRSSRVTQLPSNGQELFLYGLTAIGE